MNRYYGIIIPITFHSFLLPFLKMVVLLSYAFKAFKETDVFKAVLRLFHNDGPIYDKALEL